MKLYYKPGACSLASHIILKELNATFEIERVDTKTKVTETGADFTKINPLGYIPALQLDNGEILIEGVAIMQYLADQQPQHNLAPAPGTVARARLQQHLNFIASELHKAFSPLFSATLSDEERQKAKDNAAAKLDHFENILANGSTYLLGEQFTLCDAYLFVVANWTKPTGIGLEKWPHIAAFCGKVFKRPAVQAAMRAEGLIQ